MHDADKYINKRRGLSVDYVLKNKKYLAILKLILWSEYHHKKIKIYHLKYALVKDHGTIDTDNLRIKNKLETFFSGDSLKDITQENLHNSESTFRNYLSNLSKIGLITRLPASKGYDFYKTTDKFKISFGKKRLHDAIEKVPEEPGIHTYIILKIAEAVREFKKLKNEKK